MAPETFDTLINEIEHGATLKAAIATARTSWRALTLHLERDESAASRYARARSISAQWWADKAVEAVESVTTGEGATIGRVKADVYRWRASKANPREYGDKIDVQAVVAHTVSGVIALPDEETPLPRTTVTAALLASPSTRGDDPQAVDAPHVTPSDLAQHVNDVEGGGGGDGTMAGGVTVTPTA